MDQVTFQSAGTNVFKDQTSLYHLLVCIFTPGWQQSKTLIPSLKVDKKSLETEFLIVICRDKWQSKTVFLAIFDPHSSIVKSFFDCRLPGVISVQTVGTLSRLTKGSLQEPCHGKFVPNVIC